jgi:fusion protein PurCD
MILGKNSITAKQFEEEKIQIGRGKVKTIFEHPHYNLLTIEYSDDLSCFNKYRCYVDDKGEILNHINAWWMKQTKHIIPNHYLFHSGKKLLVKKCKRIDIEVIVRGYYTGSLCREGNASKYGIELPDSLIKDQKFEHPIITPTTKDDDDAPLTEQQIFDLKLATPEEWDYIKQKAFELFEYGETVSRGKGLILVDTKYEFGYDEKGEIILIDEMHTPDSSRYWDVTNKNAYDKDHVRNFVLQNPETEIPQELKDKTRAVYAQLYYLFTVSTIPNFSVDIYNYYINHFSPLVVIIAGSESDIGFTVKINYELQSQGIIYHNHFHSAHKETMKVISIVNYYNDRKGKTIFVTVAGCSNALGGVVAANTKKPVVNCPPYKDDVDMYMNLNSSIMMPSGVPSSIIVRPDNLALFIRNIFNF